MGIFSWLFPKPADRIAKAAKLMEQERFAEARMQVVDIEEPSAVEIVKAAEMALVRLNLDKAVQRGRAGDVGQVEAHLDTARRYHDGSLEAEFERVGNELEELFSEQAKVDTWNDLVKQAERRAQLGTDPGDFTLAAYTGEGSVGLIFGKNRAFNLPGVEYGPLEEWFKPTWMTDALESGCLLYTSPSPRDKRQSRMPSSA